jgi:hypothetical protein
MKMQQIKFEGYIMDYDDLEKVVPIEFKEFNDVLNSTIEQFKLQDEDLLEEVVTMKNIIGYLHNKGDILYDELEEEDLEVVGQIKTPYKCLLKAFVNKTGLYMSLFYSEAFNLVVEFSRIQVVNSPSRVDALNSLGVNFRFAEWVEDEWFEK